VLDDRVAIPTYLASVALPLADIRRMLARRQNGPKNRPQGSAR